MRTVIVPGFENCSTPTSWSVGADLTGGDDVLDLGHHHRDDRQRLGDAGDLADHADLHHAGLDLSETGQEARDPAFGHEDAGGPQHRVDHVAGAQRELLDDAVRARDDQRAVERHLRLGQLGLGGRDARGKLDVELGLHRVAGGLGRGERGFLRLDPDQRLLDLAVGDRARAAIEKLGAGVVFVLRLPEVGPRLGDPGLGLGKLRRPRRPCAASSSAIRACAVCTSACCWASSSLKSGSPSFTRWFDLDDRSRPRGPRSRAGS